MKCQKEVDHRKSSPEAVYELKQVALRLREQGTSMGELVRITRLSDQTLRNAFAAYDRGGLDAIKPKRRGRKPGEKRTLTPEQEAAVSGLLVDRTPEEWDLPCCLWTRESVRALIRYEYAIDMPTRTVGEYLKRWGFTVQRPAKCAMKQNPDVILKWLKEDYPAIHEQALNEHAEIFWGDETAIQNVANYARGYAPRGKTPVLKIQSERMHISMLSAISSIGKLYFLLYSKAINSQVLIDFMERLTKEIGHKVYLILDNLKVHHSKQVRAWVGEHSEKIALHYLPSYSPEYNPDEYLNHDLKRTLGTQIMVKDKQELQSRTETFMNSLSTAPNHVISYFEHPKLHAYKL